MASARRPAGLLRSTILQVMENGAPMRAGCILDQVHRAGLAVPPSHFFRDLRKLVLSGAVIRINLARSYMLAPAEPRIFLFCQTCGEVSAVAEHAMFDMIAGLAEKERFSSSRTVVEVPGVCSTCRVSGG